MDSRFLEIPGYVEACHLQDERRDSDFLDLPKVLCGFPCVAMTARHLAILIHSRSPFVCGGFPLAENVAQFLWVLHPQFSYTDTETRDAFIAEVGAKEFATVEEYEAMVQEIRDYVDACFMDSPPSGDKGGESYNSFMASIVDVLAREYGWTRGEVLALPLSELFQYIRLIDHRNTDGKEPQINRLSDGAKGRWLASVQPPPQSDKPETN